MKRKNQTNAKKEEQLRKKKAQEEEEDAVEEQEEEDEEEEEDGDDDDEGEEESEDSSDDDDDDDDDDSEDDIKLYGSGVEDEEDDDDEDDEEEEEEQQTKALSKVKKGDAPSSSNSDKKKKKEEGKSSSSSAAAGSSSSGKGSIATDVSFDFSDPDEKFFFGIRALLQWLNGEGVEISSLAELIVQEKGLGTVINCTNETDVFAMATTLNASFHKDNQGMTSLKAMLTRHCPSSLSPALKNFLESPETYILLHARFVNLPLPLIPLLHQSMKEDMTWAQKQDSNLPRIKHIITISPCTVDFGGSGGGAGKKKGGGSGGSASSSSSSSSFPYAPNDAIYDRFEDELFAQEGEMSYCFRTASTVVDTSSSTSASDPTSQPSKKNKKKKGGGGGDDAAGGSSSSSSGIIVSVIDEEGLGKILPQIKQMTG